MFVPREKNINVIEESFVLLKPDVSESHGILIDLFTNSGFSVTAKRIPRSQPIIEKIVHHFPYRTASTNPASSRRHYERLVSGMKQEKQQSALGDGSIGRNRNQPQSPSFRIERKNSGLVSGGDDDDDADSGGSGSRMRSHRRAITTISGESPMSHFIKSSPSQHQQHGGSLSSTTGALPGLTTSFRSGSPVTSGGLMTPAGPGGDGGGSPKTWSFGDDGKAAAAAPPLDGYGHGKGTIKDQAPTYAEQLHFISTGTCLALVLTSVNAVEAAKLLCGPENPAVAKVEDPESVRAEFGTNYLRNAVFCAPSHDVASELIELVFGYKTQTRTEVVRFTSAPKIDGGPGGTLSDKQKNEIQLERRKKQLAMGTSMVELEATDTDTLSSALDAAIFGADIVAQSVAAAAQSQVMMSPKQGGGGGAGVGGGGFVNPLVAGSGGTPHRLQTDAYGSSGGIGFLNVAFTNLSSGGFANAATMHGADEREQHLKRHENILRAREIDLILRERALAESSWSFRAGGIRSAEPAAATASLFAGTAAAHGPQNQALHQKGVPAYKVRHGRLPGRGGGGASSSSASSSQGIGASPSSAGAGASASGGAFIPESLLNSSRLHRQEQEQRNKPPVQHSFGSNARWVPLHFPDSRSDQFKVIFSSPADQLPQQFNVSLARQQELEQGTGHNTRGQPGGHVTATSFMIPTPPPKPGYSNAVLSDSSSEFSTSGNFVPGLAGSTLLRRGSTRNSHIFVPMGLQQKPGQQQQQQQTDAHSVGGDIGSLMRKRSAHFADDVDDNSTLFQHLNVTKDGHATTTATTTAPSPPPFVAMTTRRQQKKVDPHEIDTELLYEAGSDKVKLKSLFEKFECRMAATMRTMPPEEQQRLLQDDAHLVKFGRCIPRDDLVAFVKKAAAQGGTSAVSSVGAADDAALCRPILSFVESHVGRAGRAFCTFDEFVLVTQKVLQM